MSELKKLIPFQISRYVFPHVKTEIEVSKQFT